MTKEEKFQAKLERMCYWHKWFAWHPVKIVHPTTGVTYRVWLETIGRKCVVYTSYADYSREYFVGYPSYCFAEDLLVNTLQDNELIDKRDR